MREFWTALLLAGCHLRDGRAMRGDKISRALFEASVFEDPRVALFESQFLEGGVWRFVILRKGKYGF